MKFLVITLMMMNECDGMMNILLKFGLLNSFQAIVPLTGQEKGVLFYGGISPSKIGHNRR
jgi:hypothetical protein